MSEAKISVPPTTRSTTAVQYGAYRSILDTTGGEDERDQEQMTEVVAQARHECRDGDQRDACGATEVAPHHDLLAVEAIRDDARGRRKQHRGDGVGEQRHSDRRAAVLHLIREDDQREQKKLVSQLSGQLSEPNVSKSSESEDCAKAARALDWQPYGIHESLEPNERRLD